MRPQHFSKPRPVAWSRRQGLTLIELVVVMVVLVALVGLLVPLLPGMVERAHASTSATNISELAKLIHTYRTAKGRFPDDYDALVTAAGVADPQLPGIGANLMLSAGLAQDDLDSLNAIGIDSLVYDDGAGESATIDHYDEPAEAIAIGSKLLTVLPAYAQAVFGLAAPPTKPVVFGIGNGSSLRPKWMPDAPLHFVPDSNPATQYARFAAVYDIPPGGEPAEFLGVVALHDNELETVTTTAAEFHHAD